MPLLAALMTMVNGGVVTVSNSYNSRVQPVVLSAATTGQTVLSLSYNFHVGNFDNGNIYQIANNRDTTRTQSFTYTLDAWGNLTNRARRLGHDRLQDRAAECCRELAEPAYGLQL
jgi:hypothetical protein